MSISRILLAAVVLLSNCPAGPPTSRDREADAMQQRGAELVGTERSEEARAPLSGALRRHLAVGDHAAASTDTALLSRMHQMASRFPDAIRLADQARVQAELSGEEEALANALIASGDTLEFVGDHPRALDMYTTAARHMATSNKKERARVAIQTSVALIELGRRREARRKLEEARELALDIGAYGLVLAASVNLSEIALAEDRLDDAEDDLVAARSAALLRKPARLSHGALLNESVLARRRGNLAAALAALGRIQGKLSENTLLLATYERGMIAEASGDLALAEDRFKAAVDIVEKQRAKLAPDAPKAPFLEDRWRPYESLFALRLRRGDARGAFATLMKAQGRMFLDALAVSVAEMASAPPSPMEGAIDRISRLKQAMPLLATSPIRGTRSPEETLALVRGKHVLTYFPAGGRLRLLAIVNGEPRATSVDVDLKELDRLIDDFRARPEDAAAAESLGNALLPPEALPAPPARIHVVPVGPLLHVSFAALRVSGERLLDRYEVVYAPSVTGLAEMAAESAVAAVGPGLVVADTRSDLEHATIESTFVAEQTGATRRVGPAATIAAVQGAAELPLLHVISHSGLGVRGGYLLLADGQVTAADILEWRVSPRLVVLPTCASAATVRNEMWDSLAAAFLAAGSRHVVATVASVQDRVAADFTRHFYREDGMRDPVGGVTRALRAMAKRYPVADWSAFVVAGL
jgi:tetratricopeptide (TPR) repeat protein